MDSIRNGRTAKERFNNNIELIKQKANEGVTKKAIYEAIGISKKTFTNYLKNNSIEWKDPNDLRGKKFGRLTVLERNGSKGSNSIAWDCLCECGNIKKRVSAAHLRNGAVSSCGCLQAEAARRVGAAQINNLKGRRFGKLTAIRYLEPHERATKRNHTGAAWLCKCDCGKEIETTSKVLLSNEIKSCGCSTMSLGEMEIADELTANGVEFISEKSFDDLRSDSNGVPRYDFYLPKQNAVIEFQGKQHYQETTFFGENNSLEKNRARDRLKREYAISKGMKYIEVHFSELGNINIMKRI